MPMDIGYPVQGRGFRGPVGFRGGFGGRGIRGGGFGRFPGFRRNFFPVFPIYINPGYTPCYTYDAYGRCCDRFGRCCDRFGRCTYMYDSYPAMSYNQDYGMPGAWMADMDDGYYDDDLD